MYVLTVRNINHALYSGINLLKYTGQSVAPRGLATIEAPCPVATVYEHPCERVLFDERRDANPFFHFFEALWILAGRKDVAFLAQFNKKMADYSDDGDTFHAPYGHRLRHFPTRDGFMDQLDQAIELLSRDHDTRQVVLQIWNAEKDLGAKTKDLPCNDLIFLKIRHGRLDMRVCCRSNDMIWGAYGANVVQFSMLLEYLATMIGVEVGVYTQISDSFHVYTDNEQWKILSEDVRLPHDPYEDNVVVPERLVTHRDSFDAELRGVLGALSQFKWQSISADAGILLKNHIFRDVAFPLFKAWHRHKETHDGWRELELCPQTDWRLAAVQWLMRHGETNSSNS